jgi:hypothetical protein
VASAGDSSRTRSATVCSFRRGPNLEKSKFSTEDPQVLKDGKKQSGPCFSPSSLRLLLAAYLAAEIESMCTDFLSVSAVAVTVT